MVVDLSFRLIFWTALTLCTYLALSPSPPQLPIFKLGDVVLHGAAFVVLTVGLLLAYPRRRRWEAFCLLLCYGAGIELVQSLEPERTAELKDLAVDVIGIACGLGLHRVIGVPVRGLARRLAGRLGLA